MSLEAGRTLLHYRMLEKIGEGGTGEVWRATDTRLGRDVAIRLLPSDLAGDPERLARVRREAEVLASPDPPNVAAVRGLEEADGLAFLVLDLVEGAEPAARRMPSFWLTTAAILLTAIVMLAVVQSQMRGSPPAETRRFLAIDGPFEAGDAAPPVLSPDGRRVVFLRDGSLWVRAFDDLAVHRLEGTRDAHRPTWSPDSRQIAFVGDGDLFVVDVSGGSPRILAAGIGDVGEGGGLAWLSDRRVVFAVGDSGLSVVPDRGGETRELLVPAEGEDASFREPAALPGGRVLFVTDRHPHGPDTLEVFDGTTRKRILRFESEEEIHDPAYVSTGHVVFRRERGRPGLWAVAFDARRLVTTGAPFLVAPDGSFPSASDGGALQYVRDANASATGRPRPTLVINYGWELPFVAE